MAIAVAYDGTDSAVRALKYAIGEALDKNASLLLVYALPPEKTLTDKNPIIRSLSFSEVAEHYRQAITESIHEMLEDAEKEIRAAGLECEARVLNMGNGVGPDIIKFLQEEGDKIDCIVVGIQKRSPTGKALFGSTAQYIILHSPRPVVTVNPGIG